VILRHRDIPAENLVYWYKDHELALKIDGNRVVLSARPSSAAIEHAIRQMILQIDEELSLCRRLADEKHFEICPGIRKPTNHVWDLLPRSHHHVEKRGVYEYMDGAFRPDTNKLLELLSGVQLYGSPFEGIRELVQNAFDAVRVDMAYARLASGSPNDSELLRSLTTLHHVNLRLDITSEGPCLTCEDTGAGMTKNIIGNRFLISGSGKKHDMLALERRAEKAGFRVASTGQFGIGVLSYFMICDRLQITTRRATHADNDQEPCGWTFDIEGLSSFGELRRNLSARSGTIVSLFIKNELVQADLTRLYAAIRDYLVRRLHWLPCKFSLSSAVPGCERLDLPAGWAEPTSTRVDWILDQFAPEEDDSIPLLDSEKRTQKAAEEEHWLAIKKEAAGSLQWRMLEGELPSGLGIYRIAIPYFRILNENLLGFVCARRTESDVIEVRRVGKGVCLLPEGRTRVSWKGFIPMMARGTGEHFRSIRWEQRGFAFPWEHRSDPSRSVHCDISLESNDSGEISVNRQQLNLSQKTRLALNFVSDKIDDLENELLAESKGSDFETLNARLAQSRYFLDELSVRWPATVKQGEEEHTVFVEHKFPVIVQPQRFPPAEKYRLNGESVSTVPFLQLHSRERYNTPAFSCFRESFHPEKIVCCPFIERKVDIDPAYREQYLEHQAFLPDYYAFDTGVIDYEGTLWSVRAGLVPVWTRTGVFIAKNNWGILTSFPPEWRHLCGAYFENCFGRTEKAWLWNESNPIVRRVDSASWDWINLRFPSDKTNPLTYKNDLLSQASIAAAWILVSLKHSASEIWDALKDNEPQFLPAVWELVLGDATGQREVCQWYEGSSDVKFRTLTSSGWQATRKSSDQRSTIQKLLPIPSREWRIEFAGSPAKP
jgi:Histidine kinase-, DNA gyrase B-, and HSP90-like ATPase